MFPRAIPPAQRSTHTYMHPLHVKRLVSSRLLLLESTYLGKYYMSQENQLPGTRA